MRTFIAVPISASIRKRALDLIDRLGGTGAPVKWVAAANLHFTLKFLGEVQIEATADVCARVIDAASGQRPFSLVVQGAGAFPRPARPRAIWLGATDGTDEIVALHRSIEKALLPMGFRREQRRFVPHLTIGRVRSGPQRADELAALIENNADFAAGKTPVDEVVVVASFLDSTGPTYQRLGRAPLTGDG
jgi:2'-5' RNA ligase